MATAYVKISKGNTLYEQKIYNKRSDISFTE